VDRSTDVHSPEEHRASGLPSCARCAASMREEPLFSPSSGDALCRSCFDAESMQGVDRTLGKSRRQSFVHERRCARCGGKASAHGSIQHEVHTVISAIAQTNASTLQNGGETIFRCEKCGDQFTVFNRLRVILFALAGWMPLTFAASEGLSASHAHHIGGSGWFGMGLAVLVALGIWWPLLRDIRNRVRHPPIVDG
jgi:hypothetical protein